MNCIVTAGPTFEPLDGARRLTNFSTGRLGAELADFLVEQGHQVTLLVGEQARFRSRHNEVREEQFSTTADLLERLRVLSGVSANAVFHAAAVSDFRFGKIWRKGANGELTEIVSGKYATREGTLLAELVPTPKVIRHLRDWFPEAFIAGWKYEVEGTRDNVVRLAREQSVECRTDVCVANGPAYGLGFGLVSAAGDAEHFRDPRLLYSALEQRVAIKLSR